MVLSCVGIELYLKMLKLKSHKRFPEITKPLIFKAPLDLSVTHIQIVEDESRNRQKKKSPIILQNVLFGRLNNDLDTVNHHSRE